MNFLETGPFSFNYASMGLFSLFLLLLLVSWYCVGAVRMAYLQKEIGNEKGALKKISLEKDKRLEFAQLAGKRQLEKTAEKKLTSIFTNPPVWSSLLQELAGRVPKQIRLKSIEVSLKEEEGAYFLDLVGRGNASRMIAHFISRLDDSLLFQNAKLLGTKDLGKTEDQGIDFHVQVEINTERLKAGI